MLFLHFHNFVELLQNVFTAKMYPISCNSHSEETAIPSTTLLYYFSNLTVLTFIWKTKFARET